MPYWKTYLIPKSLDELSKIINNSSNNFCVIGGGTDLLLDIQQKRRDPVDCLIDLTQIPELTKIETKDNKLFIGSAVTMKFLSTSDLVKMYAYSLYQASGMVGGPQVRNVATIGGNVAHGLPAADGTIALLPLNARVELITLEGFRNLPIESLFLAPGKTILSRTDIIKGFYIPLFSDRQGSAFGRIMRPQGVALPILNLSVWIEREENFIKQIRLSVGPAGPTPKRGYVVEEFLRGKELSNENLEQAISILTRSMVFRSSPHRATREYRELLCKDLFGDVIKEAWVSTF